MRREEDRLPQPSVTVRLPATRERVGQVIADPARDPQWSNAVRTCDRVAGEPGQVGPRYRFTEGLAARRARPGTIEVTAIDPPARMVTVAETDDHSYEITFDLVEADDGGTLLTQTSDATFRGPAGRAPVLFTPLMAWQMRRQFRALRDLLADAG